MITKKRWYCVWMLVFVLLMFTGCKKGQEVFVEKSLKKILKKMEPTGTRSETKRIQRSLAIHILADHTALMANFQSNQFSEMEKVWKNAIGTENVKVYLHNDNGVRGAVEVPDTKFWEDLYEAKKKECRDAGHEAASIEIVIYSVDISLEDINPVEGEEDCKSTEVFEFKIIAHDEKGNVISNQDGEGRRDRFHSTGCPWG